MITRLIFKLGYNVSNLFRKNTYQMNAIEYIISILITLGLIFSPIGLYIFPNRLANLVISKYGLSQENFFDIKMVIIFAVAIIYTTMFMLYFISKVIFVKKSFMRSTYIIDSFYYESNINGRVKKMLLKSGELDDDNKEDIIINLVPFRKNKVGTKLLVFSRDYKGKNIHSVEGDLRVAIMGFAFIVIIEFLLGLLFVLM
jgi:hypothetical protein